MDNAAATDSVKTKRISNTSGLKTFFQQLSRGLMLPIAMLPIAGLFLGIGAGINNALISAGVTNANAFIIGDIMTSIGDVIFGNLPVLFAIAIAITYTDDAGGAALSAFVGWVIFNAIQAPFISDPYIANVNGFESNVVSVAFYDTVSSALITQNVGINSMNTSVFGGILIGALVAFLYNKFHKINLPPVIGFFSGVRFVPIITFATSALVGMIFVLIWPIIAIGIADLGTWITGLPIGLNSLFFGIIERALVPFGLHHVFYTPLWYTAAGGSMDLTQIYVSTSAAAAGTPLSAMPGVDQTFVQGDQSIWIFINSSRYLSFDDVYYISHHLNEGSTAIQSSMKNSNYYLTWDAGAVSPNYNPGQYMQGKFVFMIFGLPAAGAAMVMAAKKENRQVALSIIAAAAFTTFLTGITEPIEFTFLFLAPFLFFVFHVFMAGLAFWITNVMGCHVGLTFSGGLIDLLIYGVLPSVTGNSTHVWKIVLLGLAYIPIYYFVFYYYITWKDIPTPGRAGAGEEIKLYSKKDYQEKIANEKNEKEELEEISEIENLIINLGGFDNLTKIDACATRLRITVKDRDMVKDDRLKEMGAFGISGKGVNVQVIFGGKADILKTQLREAQSGKLKINEELIEREIAKLNNLDYDDSSSSNNNVSDLSKDLNETENLLANLGGFDNLTKIDACATRLRITVKDRDMVKDDRLKEMGAFGISGKGVNVQVIFGGKADILKTQLREAQSGKLKINEKLVKEQIEKLNNPSPIEDVNNEQDKDKSNKDDSNHDQEKNWKDINKNLDKSFESEENDLNPEEKASKDLEQLNAIDKEFNSVIKQLDDDLKY